MIITDYYINQLTANERGVHMSIPKYQQIKQSLLYEINNGMFQPGDKFYSEAELKKKYNVSGITAIKALQCLTNEISGKGDIRIKGQTRQDCQVLRYREVQERSRTYGSN